MCMMVHNRLFYDVMLMQSCTICLLTLSHSKESTFQQFSTALPIIAAISVFICNLLVSVYYWLPKLLVFEKDGIAYSTWVADLCNRLALLWFTTFRLEILVPPILKRYVKIVSALVSLGLTILAFTIPGAAQHHKAIILTYLILDFLPICLEMKLAYEVSLVKHKRMNDQEIPSDFNHVFLKCSWPMLCSAACSLTVFIMHLADLDPTYYFYQTALGLRTAFIQIYNESLAKALMVKQEIRKQNFVMLKDKVVPVQQTVLPETVQLKST